MHCVMELVCHCSMSCTMGPFYLCSVRYMMEPVCRSAMHCMMERVCHFSMSCMMGPFYPCSNQCHFHLENLNPLCHLHHRHQLHLNSLSQHTCLPLGYLL